MECPYCNGAMEKGVIYGDRGSLKWIEKSKACGTFISIFQQGITLKSFLDTDDLEAYYCKTCKKIIIDVNNESK